jgi:hypothetical protein
MSAEASILGRMTGKTSLSDKGSFADQRPEPSQIFHATYLIAASILYATGPDS